jgi:hypothetical protein
MAAVAPAPAPASAAPPNVRTEQTFGKYLEEQDSLGCGRHALNNFFGKKIFIKEAKPRLELNQTTFKRLGVKPYHENIPLQSICRYLSTFPHFDDKGIPLECPDNENYDVNVIQQAFGVLGYTAFLPKVPVPRPLTDWKNIPAVDDPDVKGYFVNFSGPNHWVALRKIPPAAAPATYKFIDSAVLSGAKPTGINMTLQQFKDTYRNRIGTALEIKFTGVFEDKTDGHAARAIPPAKKSSSKLSRDEIIAEGRLSYKKIKGEDASPDDDDFSQQIKALFASKKFRNCLAMKSILRDETTELLKEETTDYWNVMNAYLHINKKDLDDETGWKDIDNEYKHLAEAHRLTKFNMIVKNFEDLDYTIMRGGLRPQNKSTSIFNSSLIKNDDIEIAKFNRGIARTEKRILDEIEFLDKKYSSGDKKLSASSKTAKYVGELKSKAYSQEKEKYDYIEQISHPEHRFEKILNKFKTESQLISWLEKAKTENIKATAESKKANQKLKALSTMKESIDDCIEKMKKTLNYKCEMIMQYRNILDQSKELEGKQKTILDLSTFMVDPGRGLENTREAMMLMNIDTVVPNGLNKYWNDLALIGGKEGRELIRYLFDFTRAGNTIDVLIKNLKTIFVPGIKKLSEDPLFAKIGYIKDELEELKKLVKERFTDDFYTRLQISFSHPTIFPRTVANSEFINDYLIINDRIKDKIQFLDAILTTKSTAPVIPEILRKRQETGDLREKIKDTLEELNEAKSSPIDVSKCIDEYKKVVARENTDLEKEIGRIETATDDLLKKVPQSIEDLKNQIKVFNQGGPGGPGQGQGQGQGQGKIIKLDQVKSMTSIADIVTALSTISNAIREAENRSKANPANTDLVANILRMKQTKEALIKRKEDLEKTPLISTTLGGGRRAYGHSTRRYIRR